METQSNSFNRWEYPSIDDKDLSLEVKHTLSRNVAIYLKYHSLKKLDNHIDNKIKYDIKENVTALSDELNNEKSVKSILLKILNKLKDFHEGKIRVGTPQFRFTTIEVLRQKYIETLPLTIKDLFYQQKAFRLEWYDCFVSYHNRNPWHKNREFKRFFKEAFPPKQKNAINLESQNSLPLAIKELLLRDTNRLNSRRIYYKEIENPNDHEVDEEAKKALSKSFFILQLIDLESFRDTGFGGNRCCHEFEIFNKHQNKNSDNRLAFAFVFSDLQEIKNQRDPLPPKLKAWKKQIISMIKTNVSKDIKDRIPYIDLKDLSDISIVENRDNENFKFTFLRAWSKLRTDVNKLRDTLERIQEEMFEFEVLDIATNYFEKIGEETLEALEINVVESAEQGSTDIKQNIETYHSLIEENKLKECLDLLNKNKKVSQDPELVKNIIIMLSELNRFNEVRRKGQISDSDLGVKNNIFIERILEIIERVQD